MLTPDSRRNPVTASESAGTVRAFGLRVVPALLALSATELFVQVEPGEVVIDHAVGQLRGQALQINAGNTLTDGKEIRAAIVAYVHPVTRFAGVAAVELEEVTTGDGADVTDAEIEAVIPVAIAAAKAYTVLAQVVFSRSGSAITLTIDHTARTFGVDAAQKEIETHEDFTPPATWTGGAWVPGPTIHVSIDAADFGNKDYLTDYPIDFYGRIVKLRRVTERTIAGAGAVTNVGIEIGTTALSGASVASTLADATGSVASDEPTAPGIVKPGDVVSLVGSGSTAGSGGRARFEIVTQVLKA